LFGPLKVKSFTTSAVSLSLKKSLSRPLVYFWNPTLLTQVQKA